MHQYNLEIFVFAAALCIVGQLALARSLIAGRVKGVSETRTSRLAEITWIVLPAVVLALVLMATWRLVGSSPVAHAVTPLAS